MTAEPSSRAAALSAVVALVTAEINGVDVDRTTLLGDVTEAEALDAAVWLASLLTEHIKDDSGTAILQIAGQVAGFVDATHGP